MKLAWVSTIALALLGCAPVNYSLDFDPSSTYAAAAQYSAEHAGNALLVYKNDLLVFESYPNGDNVNSTHLLFSGSKSFGCALAVAAVQDGILTSLDEVASTTITEWQSDPARSPITVRQLLSLTSGLNQSLDTFVLGSGNKYSAAIAMTSVSTPGTAFSYGEVHITAFAELMRRKLAAATGEDPLAYLKRRVFTPIGLNYGTWVRDTAGNPMISFGGVLSAREWGKYGILIKNNGLFAGTQVLPAATLSQCFTPGGVMPAYGLTFWLNQPVTNFQGVLMTIGGRPTFTSGGVNGILDNNGPADIYLAAGLADNRLVMIPSKNLVAVRLGNGSLLSNWQDGVFLAKLLGQ
ncbi:MAG: serine hydrolase domain-containing protein [Bdellovibrionota bacterium]